MLIVWWIVDLRGNRNAVEFLTLPKEKLICANTTPAHTTLTSTDDEILLVAQSIARINSTSTKIARNKK